MMAQVEQSELHECGELRSRDVIVHKDATGAISSFHSPLGGRQPVHCEVCEDVVVAKYRFGLGGRAVV